MNSATFAWLTTVLTFGVPALRARSVALTGYLATLLADLPVEVITPADPSGRGAQLSLRLADFRAPDIIRVAPIPLYNTYHDAWRFARILKALL